MGKSEATRQCIIEQAATIFNMHGYAGTSMSRLTGAIGMTKGAIYGNFKNKDEIALAAFEFNIQKIALQIQKQVYAHENACDRLIAYARFYLTAFDDVAKIGGCPILNAAIDSDNDVHLPLKKLVVNALESWMNAVIKIVRKGVAAKEIRDTVDPVRFATAFVSLIEGGIMLSKVTGKKDHLRRNVEHLIELVNETLRV